MTRLINTSAIAFAGVLIALMPRQQPILAQGGGSFPLTSRNGSGIVQSTHATGKVDPQSPFFKELGTNGRSCFSCHRPAEGWSITPESVQARFDASQGLDPIFRANDGSNCQGADTFSVEQRRGAFSLLLNRGFIRVGIELPAGAEFVVDHVDDPYSCAPSNEVSVYRRPLPSTNLRFLTALMWDGRESTPTSTLHEDLMRQANDATKGHAQSFLQLTAEEAGGIVSFETGLFTAQSNDNDAGPLLADGAGGGQRSLAQQTFFVGINDPVGLNPTGAPFDPRAFTLFDNWAAQNESRGDPIAQARAAIFRGQELFNTRQFVIAGVAGLNNQTFSNGITVPNPIVGTCTVCHDSPNVGNHSVRAPLNIGLSDKVRRTPDMPLYTLRRLSTGDTVETTDPGRAMITGKWADIGKFKGPILRGLASRAPYFHNGAASSLEEAVEFYQTRFDIGLSDREKADLVAFLSAL